MNNIINTIKTYYPFSKNQLKQKYFAYSSRMILWVVSNTVTFLFQIMLWIAVYNSSPTKSINGYNLQELLNYIVISNVVECATLIRFESTVAENISDGRIVMSLIKPISYKKELLFRGLGGVMGSLVLFCPVYMSIGIFINKGKIALSALDLILFLIFLVLAFAMNYYLGLIFASFIFKTIKADGIYWLRVSIINLFSGALIPFSFYPNALHAFLKLSPFSYLRFIPITILLNRKQMSSIEILMYLLIGIIYVFSMAWIANLLWDKQYKQILIFGG